MSAPLPGFATAVALLVLASSSACRDEPEHAIKYPNLLYEPFEEGLAEAYGDQGSMVMRGQVRVWSQ